MQFDYFFFSSKAGPHKTSTTIVESKAKTRASDSFTKISSARLHLLDSMMK